MCLAYFGYIKVMMYKIQNPNSLYIVRSDSDRTPLGLPLGLLLEPQSNNYYATIKNYLHAITITTTITIPIIRQIAGLSCLLVKNMSGMIK
jgi:hypothetical protein